MAKHVVSVEELEKLIEVVRGQPCLYDPRNPQHKDADKLKNVWESISKIMGREDLDGQYQLKHPSLVTL